MTNELIPCPTRGFASTRKDALEQLDAFIPHAGRYSSMRNYVLPDNAYVSRLSPAIRYRLILESECAAAPLRRYAASTVEKFTQEIYWRRYWKNWLSLRPQVWTAYLDQLAFIRNEIQYETCRTRAAACEAGEGSIAIMNHFARELVQTGYLHNHARMWFAGWWIHIERLPWQLGADFFFRHLLDGDPASNTLSWRWVAGLQTPGKTYLPRRSNLEKYLPAEVLQKYDKGLCLLDNPHPLILPAENAAVITRLSLPAAPPVSEFKLGIWIHEEDLFIEESPLAAFKPCAILASGDAATWTRFRYPNTKTDWLRSALTDAAKRAGSAFGIEAQFHIESNLINVLLKWAADHHLQQIAAMRPEIGPLHDQIENLQIMLKKSGIDLVLLDRAEDLAQRPLATGGFFGYWEKVKKKLTT